MRRYIYYLPPSPLLIDMDAIFGLLSPPHSVTHPLYVSYFFALFCAGSAWPYRKLEFVVLLLPGLLVGCNIGRKCWDSGMLGCWDPGFYRSTSKFQYRHYYKLLFHFVVLHSVFSPGTIKTIVTVWVNLYLNFLFLFVFLSCGVGRAPVWSC